MTQFIKKKHSIWTVFLLFTLVLTHFHCKIKIPQKLATMKEDMYNGYKAKLQQAISNKDNFEIGIQLCNLEEKKERVYRFLRKGVLENKKNCSKALRWNQYYLEDGFKVNIIKLDTLAWKKLCLLCQNDKKSLELYNEDEKESIRKYKESVNALKIDSSKFDKQFMRLLTPIYADDQRYRGKEFDKMWRQQARLDSINLKKIELIISVRAYPSYREVGLELADAVFLVLHYQLDVATRKKYLPYLEEAAMNKKLSQGFLDLYNDRTKRLE